jgi:predicted ester cyclase
VSEENKAILDRFGEEVLNKKNLAAADEIVAEDFVELDSFPSQEQGREGLKQVLRMMFAAFPNRRWIAEEHIAEDEKVASRFTWRGTHLGEYLGIPHRQAGRGEWGGDRPHRRGKDSGQQDTLDNLGLMQQLGVIPGPQQVEAS